MLLTQDAEFLNLPGRFAGKVIVSQVSQARPLVERVAIWMPVLEAFLRDPPPQSSFELSDAGELLPWESVKS